MSHATVRIVYSSSDATSPYFRKVESLQEALEYVERVFEAGYFVFKYGGHRHVFVPVSGIIQVDVQESAEEVNT